MKCVPLQLLALALAIANLPASAHAAISAADFFCREIPVRPPEYFLTQAKNCTDNVKSVASSKQGVCVEYAYCAFVDDNLNNSLVKDSEGTEVKFNKLSTAEKTKYLKDNLPITSWLASTLTCRKTSLPGSNECPPLDQCKGDINYAWFPGAYSPEKDSKYRSSNPQYSEAFRNEEDPKVAPAK